MDASIELELTGACRKKPAARDQTRQQVARTRSNSRGQLPQAKRAGRGLHLTTDDVTPIRPRADSVGFVDTPIGQGPAMALISPLRFSDAGAVGGLMADLVPPSPLNQQESDQVDRLYQEMMERFYTIDAWEQRVHVQRRCCQYQQRNQPGDRSGGPKRWPPGGQHRRFYPPTHGNRPTKTN